jgi:exosortase/archaeosortase family protein
MWLHSALKNRISFNSLTPRDFSAWIERLFAHGGYPFLLVCACLMDLRRVLAVAVARSREGDIYQVFDEINFLVFAQWFCLVEIARRIDWSGVRATRLERFTGLALAFYGGVLVTPQSHILTAILGVWIAIKVGFTSRQAWSLAIPLALVSVQDVPSKEFGAYSLSALVVPIDVFGARSLLKLAGYAVQPINDPVLLRIVGESHGVKVIPSCATAGPAFEALAALSVFASWRRAAVGRRLVICGLLLLLGVTLINWVRLALTALSHDSYIFWHDGSGRAIIGLSYLALAFLLAELAARAKAEPLPGSQPTCTGAR